MQNYVHLDNFQGPLDLLVLLVQRYELDPFEIQLKTIVEQFTKSSIENGVDLIENLSQLIYLKSARLLPTPSEVELLEHTQDLQPSDFALGLLEYNAFFQIAQTLVAKQELTEQCHFRGVQDVEPDQLSKRHMHLKPVSLELFSTIFFTLLKNQSPNLIKVTQETWTVKKGIAVLKNHLENGPFPIKDLFSLEKTKHELIILFLAILELMKSQDIFVVTMKDSSEIYLTNEL